MTAIALILAAGRGTRAGGTVPKQWAGMPGGNAVVRSVRAFVAAPGIDAVQVVIDPADRNLHDQTIAEIDDPKLLPVVTGSDSRQGSARNGLNALQPHTPREVLIHDAARPFVRQETISAVLGALKQSEGVVPLLPVSDSIWATNDENRLKEPLAREFVRYAQTPQGFRFPEILAAHEQLAGSDLGDDASVARRAGLSVVAVPGDAGNWKITTGADLDRARDRVASGARVPRVGQGVDVHAFGPGNVLWLCGVRVPHTVGLVGHSDADVGLHAVVDAILGALCAGDIGDHFPPDDPKWADCPSRMFVEHARALAERGGWRVAHVDVTLVCETPRLAPHRPAMREATAAMLDLPVESVSIKATTAERLGFVGRGEGIAAFAIASLAAMEATSQE